MKDAFRKEVGDVSHATIYSNESGKSRGAGIVEFPTTELAKKALQLKSFAMKDRKINIQEYMEGDRDQYGYLVKKVEG